MEGRGNLESFASFRVPGLRRSRGRVRHIAHIPKCQFRTPVSEALTMNNFFFAAEARTPSRPVRFPGVGWIRAGRERGRIRRIARPVWERSEDAIWRREREFRGTSEGERAERAPARRVWQSSRFCQRRPRWSRCATGASNDTEAGRPAVPTSVRSRRQAAKRNGPIVRSSTHNASPSSGISASCDRDLVVLRLLICSAASASIVSHQTL